MKWRCDGHGSGSIDRFEPSVTFRSINKWERDESSDGIFVRWKDDAKIEVPLLYLLSFPLPQVFLLIYVYFIKRSMTWPMNIRLVTVVKMMIEEDLFEQNWAFFKKNLEQREWMDELKKENRIKVWLRRLSNDLYQETFLQANQPLTIGFGYPGTIRRVFVSKT